jgi:PAS domain S-box-containing protein
MSITSQQLVQYRIEELRENTDFVDALIENLIGYAIIAADFDGNIIAFNEGARQMYGYAPEEIIGKQDIEVFFPKDFIEAEKLQEIVDDLIDKGRFSYEGENVRRSGERFPAQILFTIIKDKMGKVVGFIEIVADLTERKRDQEALQDSATNFRKIITENADSMLVLNKRGIVRFVNPATEVLFERKAEELLGKAFGFPVVVGETLELDIIQKGGKTVVAEIRVVETEWKGRTAYLASLRDITERKQAHLAQERISHQLQAKVNELETFSYSIAHDLRSPLLSIEGFSRLLRDDIQNNKMERVQEDIRLIESGVRKMQQFLDSTLEYYCAGHLVGHLVKPAKNIPFGKIAKEVVTELAAQLRAVGATVSVADTFPRVDVDRTRIVEMLTNIVQNSINYRDKTRPLKIDIGHRLSKHEAVFFVRDNGIGIDESETEKVFELFYRGTADGEGNGAGLAIVKRIIEAHGGRIWAESQSGKGTTMCFTLPQQSSTNREGNNGKG